MDELVRILMVEDMLSDAKLAEREILKALKACEFRRVETREDFIQELTQYQPDLVITDYRLPRFDGMAALKIATELAPFAPVIVVTGAINEDTAVECMKAGAVDYVIKEHLKRLGQAVLHAMEEKKIRAERRKAEETLLEREELYRTLVETLPDAITVTDPAGNISYVSDATLKFYGYDSRDEILGMNFTHWVHPDVLAESKQIFQAVLAGGSVRNQELLVLRKDRSSFYGEISASCIRGSRGNVVGVLVDVRDITERKRAELALRESEALYRSRSAELETLFYISMQLRKAQNSTGILHLVAEETQRFLHADSAAVILLDAKHAYLTFELAVGGLSGYTGRSFHREEESVSRQVLVSGKPYLTADYSSDPHRLVSESVNYPYEEIGPSAFVPILSEDEILGILMMAREKKPGVLPFTQDDARMLSAIGDISGNALRRIRLFEDLQRSNQQISSAYEDTIDALSRALDLRDKDTEGHTRRLIELTLVLARKIGLDEEQLVHVRRGAYLHDMGKIGIPDTILLKPGKLTNEEWEIMRRHPQYTYDMLSHIDYLRPALDIAYCHHEKWDGSGYPRGLKGAEIPLSARLFAVVDVWDALVNERPYRPAWPREEAMQYIQEQSGKHFDPAVVDSFLEILQFS